MARSLVTLVMQELHTKFMDYVGMVEKKKNISPHSADDKGNLNTIVHDTLGQWAFKNEHFLRYWCEHTNFEMRQKSVRIMDVINGLFPDHKVNGGLSTMRYIQLNENQW